MEDNNFDLKMRSMLENGQEEVPAGLWSAIEGRLPAAAPVSKPAIWWKWAGASVAAAAAIALTVVFGFRKESPAVEIESCGQAVVADLTPQEQEAMSTEPTEELAPKTAVQAVKAQAHQARLQPEADMAETTVSVEAEDRAVTEESETTSEENEAVADSKTETNHIRGYETENFDESGVELKERRASGTRRVCLGAWSDACSNTNPTFSKNASAVMKKPATLKATSIEETSASNYGIPVTAGLGVKIPIKGRWSVGTGVNWSMLTRTFSGQFNQVDADGNIVSQSSYSSIRNTQNYLGVPVNVYFSIISKDFIDFYAYAGGSANKCLSNRYTMKGLEKQVIYKSQETGWQFSTGVGIGVEFTVADRFGFYVDPSLDYWFDDGKSRNIRTHQPLMVGLELGMRIKL